MLYDDFKEWSLGWKLQQPLASSAEQILLALADAFYSERLLKLERTLGEKEKDAGAGRICKLRLWFWQR